VHGFEQFCPDLVPQFQTAFRILVGISNVLRTRQNHAEAKTEMRLELGLGLGFGLGLAETQGEIREIQGIFACQSVDSEMR